jgi:hypothetical protein
VSYLLTAYSEGRHARQCGAPIDACKHTDTTMQAAWRLGWHDTVRCPRTAYQQAERDWHAHNRTEDGQA